MEGPSAAHPQGLYCEQLCADGQDRACVWGWRGCECVVEEGLDGVGGGIKMKNTIDVLFPGFLCSIDCLQRVGSDLCLCLYTLQYCLLYTILQAVSCDRNSHHSTHVLLRLQNTFFFFFFLPIPRPAGCRKDRRFPQQPCRVDFVGTLDLFLFLSFFPILNSLIGKYDNPVSFLWSLIWLAQSA